jgi:hypothetical protein
MSTKSEVFELFEFHLHYGLRSIYTYLHVLNAWNQDLSG